MKIIVTADLHLPITSRSTIQNLVLDIQKQAPDVVVLAGDIGETLTEPDYFQQCVELFTAALDCPVLVLAGNHDLWVHDSSPIDSMEMWTTELPAQAKQANSQWLEGQNYVPHEDWFIECSKISHIVSAHSHRANRGELRARDTMGFDDPSLREELRAAGLRSKFKSSDPVTITLGSDYRNPSYEIIESVVQ